MTTKFRAIASAVTATAIAATVSVTSLATSPNQTDLTAIPTESENLISETVKTEYGSLAEMLSPNELAAMMGEAPFAPDEGCFPEERVVEIPLSTNSTPISLKRYTDVTTYDYWTGNFVIPNLESFSISFSDPERFVPSFNGSYRRASLNAMSDYSGNYKSVHMNYTFLESDGSTSWYYVANDGNTKEVSTRITSQDYSGNGKLVEVAIFYTLGSGTGSGSNPLEYVYLHLVDSSYTKTAQFAAEPYSGLIDTYTYIPTEMCQ